LSTFNKISLLLVNILFWAVMLFIGYNYNWEPPPFSTADGTYYPSMLWGNFFNAVVIYVNALLLYPFRKRIRIPYWLAVICLILGTAILEAIVDYQLAVRFNLVPKIEQLFQDAPEGTAVYFIVFGWIFQYTFIHLGWFIFSFAIVFVYESFKNQQIQQALKEEKLKAELQFLKAQINPHFLFNGINSVYFLIDDKPKIAKSTLLKFSDLLRYQLYECQDDFIPLKKEMEHIQSYIDMEKIRRGEDAKIQLNLPDEVGTEQISPLLFTPFLENAFKYLSNHDEGNKNRVVVDFRLEGSQLFFEIENTIDPAFKEKENGGIGIQNVRKRLALLYPQKHHLNTFERNGRFIVRLDAQL